MARPLMLGWCRQHYKLATTSAMACMFSVNHQFKYRASALVQAGFRAARCSKDRSLLTKRAINKWLSMQESHRQHRCLRSRTLFGTDRQRTALWCGETWESTLSALQILGLVSSILVSHQRLCFTALRLQSSHLLEKWAIGTTCTSTVSWLRNSIRFGKSLAATLIRFSDCSNRWKNRLKQRMYRLRTGHSTLHSSVMRTHV